jgi:NAD(P)-dependent dehydrogenase (short-subunit alcohol dehydrogenase family)
MSQSTGTILLTGANGGLGSAIISKILSTDRLTQYHGIYAVRDANKPVSALLDAPVRKAPSYSPHGSAHSWEKVSLDLSKLDSVRQAASTINERVSKGEVPRIRAVILNAGYEEFKRQTWTEDGLDTTFTVNYLGHWLLVMLLLQSMDLEKGRVVWISSFSHKYVWLPSSYPQTLALY